MVVLRGIEPLQTLGFNQVLFLLSYSTKFGSPTRSRTENLSRLKGTPLPVGLQDQKPIPDFGIFKMAEDTGFEPVLP